MTLTDEMKAQGWLPACEIHNHKNGEYYEIGHKSPFDENEIIRGGICNEWGNCADALECSSSVIAFRILTPVIPAQIGLSPMLGKLRNIV